MPTRSIRRPPGMVTKAPSFYPFYTGPQWSELNAVKASGKLIVGPHLRLHRDQSGPDQPGAGGLRLGRGSQRQPAARPVHGPSERHVRRGDRRPARLVAHADGAGRGPGQRRHDRPARERGPHPRRDDPGEGAPPSLLPSTGLAPSQYRFNLLAGGRRAARLVLGRELRARVHHRPGGDLRGSVSKGPSCSGGSGPDPKPRGPSHLLPARTPPARPGRPDR